MDESDHMDADPAPSERRRTTSFADQSEPEQKELPPLTGVTVRQTPVGKVTTVVATSGGPVPNTQEISYSDIKVIGNGSFGIVFQVFLHELNRRVAIKKVLQDKRFKNRELQIMRMLSHVNVIDLNYFFYSSGSNKDELYLNLVLEYMPDTIYQLVRKRSRANEPLSPLEIKLYSYQMLRGLGYLHSMGICHRDIKPQNLLVDVASGVVKICDFGSAKILVPGEPNVSYICSRYYRAPELIFGSQVYSTAVDAWSAGCVLAELFLGRPIFAGENGVDQLVEIIKVLGTPTHEQIEAMNPNYKTFRFPQIQPQSWNNILPAAVPELADLLSRLLQFRPQDRFSMPAALAHDAFNELRDPSLTFNDVPLTWLFNFSEQELAPQPALYDRLVPPHMRQ